MADQIPAVFTRQYEADVKHIFQRQGGYLRKGVRMKTGIVGLSTTFPRVGKGVATTKARHGVITPMNQDHTSVQCSLEDFYAGDYVDRLDEAKTNIDERMVIAQGGAWALGRKVDDQILTVLDTTANSTHTWTVTSKGAIHASAVGFVRKVHSLDVPNDGNLWAVITPVLWSMLELIDPFANADYVNPAVRPAEVGMPTDGNVRRWLGVNWVMHTGLSGIGTSAAKSFIWHKNAVGYATGAHAKNNAENDMVSAMINYVPERDAHFVNHAMSGGACLIEDAVIEGTVDDTAALPTS